MKGRIRYGSPVQFFIDDVEVTKEEFDAAFPPKTGFMEKGGPRVSSTSGWPLVSEALAVHPKQIETAMARDRHHGIASEYLPDGRMVLKDRGQRRDVLKSLGLHDKQGGYGDDHAASDHPGWSQDTISDIGE